MRIACIGSRTFRDTNLVEKWLGTYIRTAGDQVISGGAEGADKLCAAWAKSKGYLVEEHLPDWKTHGKKAGFLRNIDIIKDSNLVIAFWDSKSKGTAHSLVLAKKYKIPTIIVYF
jgi:hypothetical protein